MILSTLPKTWVFDLDGTLLKHNGYKLYGEASWIASVSRDNNPWHYEPLSQFQVRM